MSLDVYLTRKRDEPLPAERAIALLRENGLAEFADEIDARHTTGDERLYDANITHNLGRMAEAAGIYQCCWRPEEIGITKAEQLIAPLTEGLTKMQADPVRFSQFNASNGWGLYENFVLWVARYLEACKEYPDADVCVSR